MDSSANSKDHVCASVHKGRSLVAQTVKNPPAIRETWVQPLCWKDSLEKGVAPLQYFCLENSIDRGAWQAIQSMGLQRVRHD